MKKKLSLFMVILLIMAMAVGCGGSPDSSEPISSTAQSSQSSQASTDNTDTGNDVNTLPLVNEPTEISIFSPLDQKAALAVNSYSELLSFKAIEEKTGVTIEWQHPADANQGLDTFNLLMASGNYPDIIYWQWLNQPGGPQKYINDNIIMDLTDLVDEYAENYSAVLDGSENYKKQVITDEGDLWGFGLLFGDFDDPDGYPKAWLGPQIRKDWLDNLGLTEPTTIDEWTTTLRAFKEKDADGDGDTNNEIPFTARSLWWNANMGITGFATSYGILWDFYNDNGTIKYGPVEEGAYEFLTLMNQWYSEGLLDQDFAGQDATAYDNKIKSGEAGSWITGGPRWTHYMTANADNPNYNPIGTVWPPDKNGIAHASVKDVVVPCNGYGAAVSASSQNKEIAVRWLDYLYSEEGIDLLNWGIEGESYTNDNGTKHFTDEILNNSSLNAEQSLARYTFVTQSGWATLQSGYAKRGLMSDAQLSWYTVWEAEADLILPNYTTTTEESDNMARVMNNVNTYVQENATKFITGDRSLDEFDQYVEDIMNMGLEEAIGYVSAAVDRYNNR